MGAIIASRTQAQAQPNFGRKQKDDYQNYPRSFRNNIYIKQFTTHFKLIPITNATQEKKKKPM